jgi:DNA-binding beta-propeller fold protein YncE
VAYSADVIGETAWDTDVVFLNPENPGQPSVTAAGLTWENARALRLRAQKRTGIRDRVYVLHNDLGCTQGGLGPSALGPGFWCEEDCSGGPGDPDTSRTLRLTVIEFISGAQPDHLTNLVLDDIPEAPCTYPSLDDAGMDFNAAGDELWIASPEFNRVWAVDLDTLEIDGLPIPVGAFPSGISLEVVQDGIERAYVANKCGNSYTVINVASRTVEEPGVFLGLGSAPTDLMVEPGGTRLLVAESGLDRVRSYVLPGNDLEHTFSADAAPRRIVIQRGAP